MQKMMMLQQQERWERENISENHLLWKNLVSCLHGAIPINSNIETAFTVNKTDNPVGIEFQNSTPFLNRDWMPGVQSLRIPDMQLNLYIRSIIIQPLIWPFLLIVCIHGIFTSFYYIDTLKS
jgi:hypothetical protein